jgi:hypothetical protein
MFFPEPPEFTNVEIEALSSIAAVGASLYALPAAAIGRGVLPARVAMAGGATLAGGCALAWAALAAAAPVPHALAAFPGELQKEKEEEEGRTKIEHHFRYACLRTAIGSLNHEKVLPTTGSARRARPPAIESRRAAEGYN